MTWVGEGAAANSETRRLCSRRIAWLGRDPSASCGCCLRPAAESVGLPKCSRFQVLRQTYAGLVLAVGGGAHIRRHDGPIVRAALPSDNNDQVAHFDVRLAKAWPHRVAAMMGGCDSEIMLLGLQWYAPATRLGDCFAF